MTNENHNFDQDQQQKEPRTRADVSRENGRKSVGPTTEQGRAISSQNALKHGCYRRPTAEDQVKVTEIFMNFCRDFKPEGMSEQLAVRQMAEAWFNKLKVDRWYQGLMDTWYTQHPCQSGDLISPEATMEEYAAYKANKKEVDNFDRMQERYSRRYDKSWRRLRTLQAERKKEEAKAAKKGADQDVRISSEKGKMYDLGFGMIKIRPDRQNEPTAPANPPPQEGNN